MPKDKVFQKLEEHDKILKSIDNRFEQVDKRFEENDRVHENIIKKLLEHDDRFDKLEQDMRGFRDEVMARLDDIVTIVKRSDIERVAVNSRVGRLENKVEKNTNDIARIDKALKTT